MDITKEVWLIIQHEEHLLSMQWSLDMQIERERERKRERKREKEGERGRERERERERKERERERMCVRVCCYLIPSTHTATCNNDTSVDVVLIP